MFLCNGRITTEGRFNKQVPSEEDVGFTFICLLVMSHLSLLLKTLNRVILLISWTPSGPRVLELIKARDRFLKLPGYKQHS